MSLFTTNDREISSSPIKTFVVSNATLLAAGNPTSSLAAGQMGAYVLDATDLRWESRTTAITDANINADLKMFFALGETYNDGSARVAVRRTGEFSVADLKYQKKVYTAPVKAQRAVGYNGTSGSLNFTTVVEGDEYLVKIIRTTEQAVPYEPYSFSYKASFGDTPYSVMSRLAKDISDDTNPIYAANFNTRRYRAELLTSLSGSAFGGSATVAAVKGATSLTTSAGHGVGVGDYVSLGGDVYKAVTGTTGTTLVLDRPYSGADATIANANALDLGATAPIASELGLRITTEQFYETFWVALDGDLAGSTLTELATMVSGSGVGLYIKEEETKGRIVEGYLARSFEHAYKYPQPIITGDIAKFYTIYHFTVRNKIKNKFEAAKDSFLIAVEQTDASTPSAFNASFDTLLGAISSTLIS